MISLIITAFFLGFVYNAAPGAVNTEALRRGLKRGFLASFSVQMGAFLGDLVWAVVGLTGVALVFHFLAFQIILGIAGVLFLLRMAWLSYLDAHKPFDLSRFENTNDNRDFLTGIIFSLANPFGIAFWGGIGGGLVTHITTLSLHDKIMFLFVGFSVGALVWCFGISVLVAWSRKFIGEKLLRGIYTVSSLAMAYFALEMLWSLFHDFVYPILPNQLRFELKE